MLPFKKKILTDEAMRPVAVLIDYQDWQQIEKILEAHKSQQKQEFNLNLLNKNGQKILSGL